MKTDKRLEEIEFLFRAFAMPFSFYVIGAGASAGIVPMTSELRESIVKRYFSFGSFPADTYQPDDTFQRVIGDPDEIEETLMSALLKRLNPSAVQAMVMKELAPPDHRNTHSYKIFLLLKKPSTIFSLNVDGLSASYCTGHYLLEPHGRVPVRLVRSPMWNELINALLDFRLTLTQIPGLLLPQPEPIHITSQLAYSQAVSLFKRARFVVFIGYSFGLFRRSFDDLETFEFFRDLLRYSSKEIIVLSPDPDFIGNAIQEATGQAKIHLIPLYWNHLCQALQEIKCLYGCNSFTKINNLGSEILYRHDELIDSVP